MYCVWFVHTSPRGLFFFPNELSWCCLVKQYSSLLCCLLSLEFKATVKSRLRETRSCEQKIHVTPIKYEYHFLFLVGLAKEGDVDIPTLLGGSTFWTLPSLKLPNRNYELRLVEVVLIWKLEFPSIHSSKMENRKPWWLSRGQLIV